MDNKYAELRAFVRISAFKALEALQKDDATRRQWLEDFVEAASEKLNDNDDASPADQLYRVS